MVISIQVAWWRPMIVFGDDCHQLLTTIVTTINHYSNHRWSQPVAKINWGIQKSRVIAQSQVTQPSLGRRWVLQWLPVAGPGLPVKRGVIAIFQGWQGWPLHKVDSVDTFFKEVEFDVGNLTVGTKEGAAVCCLMTAIWRTSLVCLNKLNWEDLCGTRFDLQMLDYEANYVRLPDGPHCSECLTVIIHGAMIS